MAKVEFLRLIDQVGENLVVIFKAFIRPVDICSIVLTYRGSSSVPRAPVVPTDPSLSLNRSAQAFNEFIFWRMIL